MWIGPRLNQIKQREQFRPIAPVCLRDDAARWFGCVGESPYMPFTHRATTDALAAVTHVNGTARLQTVTAATNAPLHNLLIAFKERTGYGVLCNTSWRRSAASRSAGPLLPRKSPAWSRFSHRTGPPASADPSSSSMAGRCRSPEVARSRRATGMAAFRGPDLKPDFPKSAHFQPRKNTARRRRSLASVMPSVAVRGINR